MREFHSLEARSVASVLQGACGRYVWPGVENIGYTESQLEIGRLWG